MSYNIKRLGLLFALFSLFSLELWATASGGGCGNTSQPPYDLEKHKVNTESMGLKLLRYLKKHAHRVAIVARAGGDISAEEFRNPSRQKYTHAGIAWKSSQDGRWRFKHVLNVCAGPQGKIFVQSLVQFFNDDPHFYDFYVGVPDRKLQDAIVKVLESDVAQRVQISRYSNIANPFRAEYQNSNGWVLNVIASAESGISSKERLIDYYTKNGYISSQVYVGLLRGIGSVFVDNATTADHSFEEKMSRWFNYVSAASLYNYLEQNGRFLQKEEICHDSGCNVPLIELNN